MKPICVVMILQGYLPRLGGAERQVNALAPLLRERSVEIQVLTRRYAGLAPFELIHGVPVHRLPIPGPKALASVSFTLSALPLLRRLQPDLIHAHELLSPATTAVMAKRLFGVPVVAKVLRGGVLGDLAKLKSKPLGKRRIRTFQRQIDAFITISQEIDDELAAIGIPVAHRHFIPNGVDVTRFFPLASTDKQTLRRALNLPDNKTIVVFAGRLAAEKRVDQLIAVWPTIKAKQPDAMLLILGDGDEAERLKSTTEEDVYFAGAVDDVVPYLQTSDIFVLPSATEGLSNALLEAQAVGLATIATAVGGATDVITHGENGLLIPSDEPTALQAALIDLLANAVKRIALGEQGRAHVVQHFALSVTADQLRALYDVLLSTSIARNKPEAKEDQVKFP